MRLHLPTIMPYFSFIELNLMLGGSIIYPFKVILVSFPIVFKEIYFKQLLPSRLLQKVDLCRTTIWHSFEIGPLYGTCHF
jgi:hypothetical protein